jgi:hypothetical protein
MSTILMDDRHILLVGLKERSFGPLRAALQALRSVHLELGDRFDHNRIERRALQVERSLSAALMTPDMILSV